MAQNNKNALKDYAINFYDEEYKLFRSISHGEHLFFGLLFDAYYSMVQELEESCTIGGQCRFFLQ